MFVTNQWKRNFLKYHLEDQIPQKISNERCAWPHVSFCGCQTITTNLLAWTNRNVFSYSLGGQRSKTEVLIGHVPSEAGGEHFLPLRPSHCPRQTQLRQRSLSTCLSTWPSLPGLKSPRAFLLWGHLSSDLGPTQIFQDDFISRPLA